MTSTSLRLFGACVALAALSHAAHAQVTASLVAAETSIQPGRPFTVAVRLTHQPRWHTYWLNAGTGYPTSLTWSLPSGWTAGEIQWPVPSLIRDKDGKVTGHGYDGVVYLPVIITPTDDAATGQRVTLQVKAGWLMCNEMCIPGEAEVQLTLPVTTDVPSAGPDSKEIAGMPMPQAQPGWEMEAQLAGRSIVLTIRGANELKSPHFFSADGFIAHDLPQAVDVSADKVVLTLQAADATVGIPARLVGVLAYTDAQGIYRGADVDVVLADDTAAQSPKTLVSQSPVSGQPAGVGLLATLGLAFIGGLILNLMPCVFPVLGIKILGFVNQSGNDRRLITLHGFVFSAGVLLSFWILAAALALLRAGGAELGWGFQLQSPAFVYSLAAVMLVFALSLSGVFEFAMSATGLGAGLQMRSGYAGSFFTGVLATVVATPCSAPFLAPALGAALALPTGESLLVFTAIAIGLALPYLLLSTFPQAVKLLPRPGPWMETFKQFMAFPLYASVGYLLWVIAGQTEESGLLMAFFGLTLIAMAAWTYGRFAQSGSSRTRATRASLCAVSLLVLGGWVGWPVPPAETDLVWTAWSPEAVEMARKEGKTVYVDFTARWCATCQTNKKLVFTNDEVQRTFREQGIVMLKADWTNRDPRITAELALWGRSAVPFNLVMRPGRPPRSLPELLTPDIVLNALKET